MIKKILFINALLLLSATLFSQAETENETKKFSFGVLPTISYDADMGFQYGGLESVYDHASGTLYPDYRQMLKIEISRYTKGSGINQLFYDAKHLLPFGLRLTADLSYLTEQKLDFFGFNGYQSRYNSNFVDDQSADYISRVFYANQREFFKFNVDLQGELFFEDLRWLAGFGIMNTKINRVDIAKLNKGQDAADQLPDVPTLYDKYIDWGILSEAERDGGQTNFLKFGAIYDTRDNEAAPETGVWTEALLFYVPTFFFNSEFSYAKLVLTYRQYFPVIKNKLTFAVRLGYQGTIGGNAPFFTQSYMITSVSSVNKSDGLGGAKNLRGVMRNRVVGDGIVQGIAELRWKALSVNLWNQNISLGVNAFFDCGQVVQTLSFDPSLIPIQAQTDFFDFSYTNDRLHTSAGAGLRIALNYNFILSVDYGFALNRKDGIGGLYINIGNLF